MSLRRNAARGSATVAGAAAVSNVAGFVRNVILAHLLTKADFGIAATLGLVISLFELSAKIGVSRFVVQDPEGNQPEFVAAAHFLQFVTAAIGALLIVASAPLLGHLFGIPDQGWALSSLAILALFRGFEHLDVYRFERELRFGPSTTVDAVSQILITAMAWPVAKWLGDYRAVLVLLIVKGFISCVLTHRAAEYRYRWAMHRTHLMRMLKLGWPLLVNGFLMFGVLNGDQFLVATFFTVSDLGPYAAAAVLVSAPTFFFAKIFSSLSLPIVSKVQADPVMFTRRYHQAISLVTVFSAACAVGTIVGSESLMRLVYGAKYTGSGQILAWIAAGNAFRIVRMAPALAALSRGDSKNQMVSNLWRSLGLLPALVVAFAQLPVWMIAASALVGEGFACAASFVILSRRDKIPMAINLVPTAMVAGTIALALVVAELGFFRDNLLLGLAAAVTSALLAGAIPAFLLPPMRSEISRLGRRLTLAEINTSWLAFRRKLSGRRSSP